MSKVSKRAPLLWVVLVGLFLAACSNSSNAPGVPQYTSRDALSSADKAITGTIGAAASFAQSEAALAAEYHPEFYVYGIMAMAAPDMTTAGTDMSLAAADFPLYRGTRVWSSEEGWVETPHAEDTLTEVWPYWVDGDQKWAELHVEYLSTTEIDFGYATEEFPTEVTYSVKSDGVDLGKGGFKMQLEEVGYCKETLPTLVEVDGYLGAAGDRFQVKGKFELHETGSKFQVKSTGTASLVSGIDSASLAWDVEASGQLDFDESDFEFDPYCYLRPSPESGKATVTLNSNGTEVRVVASGSVGYAEDGYAENVDFAGRVDLNGKTAFTVEGTVSDDFEDDDIVFTFAKGEKHNIAEVLEHLGKYGF